MIYEREKNRESLETTCCCIPYCVHRKLIEFVGVHIPFSTTTKLSSLLHGHSITSNLVFFKGCSYVRNFLCEYSVAFLHRTRVPVKVTEAIQTYRVIISFRFNLHKFATDYILSPLVFLVANFTDQFSRLSFTHMVANSQIFSGI